MVDFVVLDRMLQKSKPYEKDKQNFKNIRQRTEEQIHPKNKTEEKGLFGIEADVDIDCIGKNQTDFEPERPHQPFLCYPKANLWVCQKKHELGDNKHPKYDTNNLEHKKII